MLQGKVVNLNACNVVETGVVLFGIVAPLLALAFILLSHFGVQLDKKRKNIALFLVGVLSRLSAILMTLLTMTASLGLYSFARFVQSQGFGV